MIVTILDRGADGWAMRFETVRISDYCPTCCAPRGVPAPRPFCEDGEFYSVDCWTNPCGHVDLYPDVLREARLLELAGEGA